MSCATNANTLTDWRVGLLLVASLGGVVACKSTFEFTGPDPVEIGSFTATVVGEDLNVNLSGNAVFGIQETGPVNEWVVFLWNGQVPGTSFNVVRMFRENLDQPGPDGYSIYSVEDGSPTIDDFLAAYAFSGTAASGAFLSISGNLTITTSTPEEVTGTFEFIGILDPGSFGLTTDSVTVSGSFTAEAGLIPVL